MSIQTPETAIAAALAASSLWSPALVLGTDIKYGQPISPAIPGAAGVRFWIMPYGGRIEPLLNASINGSYHYADVQVMVLSKPNDPSGGLADARNARAALHTKEPSGYSRLTAKNAEPLNRGQDEAGRYRYSMNFTIEWATTE